ncbi:hypothetical protein BJ546DRAFT_720861 [Cryomyces antarcticus]|nr:hypothetical protein LTR04_006843 [Oleoguttula sp. CCFEE 6159]
MALPYAKDTQLSIPFDRGTELCKSMIISKNGILERTEASANRSQSTRERTLPGQPRVNLSDQDQVAKYLKDDLLTPKLDRLSPHMWLLSARNSKTIDTLTQQIVKGRNIIVTEDPELHLVWFYDRIYIKPLPKYLLSHAFWEFYFSGNDSPLSQPSRKRIGKAAQGFIRSYAQLICRKSDFLIAKSTDDARGRLIPKGVTYTEFVRFVSAFEDLLDNEVSPRYAFGQLRLTRLNFWSKIFLRRLAFERVYTQYGAYFARFYGPFAFVFAVFSVALSAMQVVFAAQPSESLDQSWQSFGHASRGFSIFSLVSVALVAVFMLVALAVLALREVVFAARTEWRKYRARLHRRKNLKGNP